MADLKHDFNFDEDPLYEDIPVAASTVIEEGDFVGDNASGYARPLVAGDAFLGIAVRRADNSSGSAGDIRVRVAQRGGFAYAVTGVSGVGNLSDTVYASDDRTLTLTQGSNSRVGQITRFIGSTVCLVRFASDPLRFTPDIRGLSNQIADPGTGEAIPVTQSGSVALEIANATETNTLAAPSFAGQELLIYAKSRAGTGTRAITGAVDIDGSGNNVATFNAAGEALHLVAIDIGGTLRWQILENIGSVGLA